MGTKESSPRGFSSDGIFSPGVSPRIINVDEMSNIVSSKKVPEYLTSSENTIAEGIEANKVVFMGEAANQNTSEENTSKINPEFELVIENGIEVIQLKGISKDKPAAKEKEKYISKKGETKKNKKKKNPRGNLKKKKKKKKKK